MTDRNTWYAFTNSMKLQLYTNRAIVEYSSITLTVDPVLTILTAIQLSICFLKT